MGECPLKLVLECLRFNAVRRKEKAARWLQILSSSIYLEYRKIYVIIVRTAAILLLGR